jgi:hypothetical protein
VLPFDFDEFAWLRTAYKSLKSGERGRPQGGLPFSIAPGRKPDALGKYEENDLMLTPSSTKEIKRQ